jgi:hypothetical protein
MSLHICGVVVVALVAMTLHDQEVRAPAVVMFEQTSLLYLATPLKSLWDQQVSVGSVALQ